MDKVCIIGCGGHARSVADVLIDNQEDIILEFFDDNARHGEILLNNINGGYRVYPISELDSKDGVLFLAVGDNKKRRDAVEVLALKDKTITIVSRRAYVSKSSEIGYGTFVAGGVHIGPEAKVGSYTIINTSSIIEHETSIGDFSHISVNSTVCGRCIIGSNVFVGAGSVIRDKVSICDDVIIGANSTVIRDIIAPGTYVGNPVKKVK